MERVAKEGKLIAYTVKIPKPAAMEGGEGADEEQKESEVPLPQTLVRIPVEPEEVG